MRSAFQLWKKAAFVVGSGQSTEQREVMTLGVASAAAAGGYEAAAGCKRSRTAAPLCTPTSLRCSSQRAFGTSALGNQRGAHLAHVRADHDRLAAGSLDLVCHLLSCIKNCSRLSTPVVGIGAEAIWLHNYGINTDMTNSRAWAHRLKSLAPHATRLTLVLAARVVDRHLAAGGAQLQRNGAADAAGCASHNAHAALHCRWLGEEQVSRLLATVTGSSGSSRHVGMSPHFCHKLG